MDTRRTMSLTPIDTVIRAIRVNHQADAIYAAVDHADAARMYNIQNVLVDAPRSSLVWREGRAFI